MSERQPGCAQFGRRTKVSISFILVSGLKLILQEEWWCKEREASIVIKLMSILVKAADLKPLIGSISDRDLLEF